MRIPSLQLNDFDFYNMNWNLNQNLEVRQIPNKTLNDETIQNFIKKNHPKKG
jgi:hypothetical protein